MSPGGCWAWALSTPLVRAQSGDETRAPPSLWGGHVAQSLQTWQSLSLESAPPLLAPPCHRLGQSDIPSPAPGTSPLLPTAPSSSVILVVPYPGRPRVPWSPGEGSGCQCPQPGQSCTGPGLQLTGPALQPILSSLLSPSLLGLRPNLASGWVASTCGCIWPAGGGIQGIAPSVPTMQVSSLINPLAGAWVGSGVTGS